MTDVSMEMIQTYIESDTGSIHVLSTQDKRILTRSGRSNGQFISIIQYLHLSVSRLAEEEAKALTQVCEFITDLPVKVIGNVSKLYKLICDPEQVFKVSDVLKAELFTYLSEQDAALSEQLHFLCKGIYLFLSYAHHELGLATNRSYRSFGMTIVHKTKRPAFHLALQETLVIFKEHFPRVDGASETKSLDSISSKRLSSRSASDSSANSVTLACQSELDDIEEVTSTADKPQETQPDVLPSTPSPSPSGPSTPRLSPR